MNAGDYAIPVKPPYLLVRITRVRPDGWCDVVTVQGTRFLGHSGYHYASLRPALPEEVAERLLLLGGAP